MSDAKSSWIVDVGDAEFQTAVLERSREVPVVVDFWATWCGPCRMIGPVLERLVAERQGEVVLAKVNVDEAPVTAGHFGISSIPAVIAFRSGRPVLDFVGALPEAQLRVFLDRIAPTEADRLAARATALEKDRPDEAEQLYRQALQADANHETAILGQARLLMSQDRDEEAAELLERMGPGSEQGDEVERLNAVLSLRKLAASLDEADARRRLEANAKDGEARYEVGCLLAKQGKYREALDMLIGAAELDPKLAAGKVREAMVSVFQVVGVNSPLADDYRKRLATLLY